MKLTEQLRRRKGLVIGGVVAVLTLLAAGGVALVAPPLARARTRELLAERCGRAFGGRCTVGAVRLARDGALATGIRATSSRGQVLGELQSVSISLDWWSLALGRAQGVRVTVSGVSLTEDAPLDEVSREVLRLRDRDRAELIPGRAWLERLVVERGSAQVRVAPFVTAAVDGLTVDSRRDGPLDVRWQNASVGALLMRVGTGSCTLHKPARDRRATLRCGDRERTIDLDEGNVSVMGTALQVLRTLLGDRAPGLLQG